MLKDYISELNERLLLGKEVIFPAPKGQIGLLEALLLSNRKGKVLSLLRLCKRREIKVGRQVYHVYKL